MRRARFNDHVRVIPSDSDWRPSPARWGCAADGKDTHVATGNAGVGQVDTHHGAGDIRDRDVTRIKAGVSGVHVVKGESPHIDTAIGGDSLAGAIEPVGELKVARCTEPSW